MYIVIVWHGKLLYSCLLWCMLLCREMVQVSSDVIWHKEVCLASGRLITTVTFHWCSCSESKMDIYVVQIPIDQYWVLTDYTFDAPLSETGSTLASGWLHSDRISNVVWSIYLLQIGGNSLYSDPVCIDIIGWWSCSWHIVFWYHIVPVRCFHFCTLLPGRDHLYTPVATLCYAIPWWHVCILQLKSNFPFV